MLEDGNVDTAADSLPSVQLIPELAKLLHAMPANVAADLQQQQRENDGEAEVTATSGAAREPSDELLADGDGGASLIAATTAGSDTRGNSPRLYALENKPWHGYRPRAGMVEKMLRWDFNTLDYQPVDLVPCLLEMLWHLGLVQKFDLEPDKVLRFSWNVRLRYRDINPYHNFLHAISVVHVCFLACAHSDTAKAILLPIDRLALLLAALAHDQAHPGHNAKLEQETLSRLAIRYNDSSVLENHHAAVLFDLLQRPGLDCISGLDVADYKRLRKIAIAAILATDMAKHGDLAKKADAVAPSLPAVPAAASRESKG